MKTLLLLLTTILLFSCNKQNQDYQDYLQLQVVDDTLYLYDNGVLIHQLPQNSTENLDSFLIDYYQ
jgi:hypothetical protein